MDKRTLATILGGAIGFVSTVSILRTKDHSFERQAMAAETRIELQAISNAEAIVKARLENGEIRSLQALNEAISTEIKFQRITLREQ